MMSARTVLLDNRIKKRARSRPPIRYEIVLERVPEVLRRTFVQWGLDEETEAWLQHASRDRVLAHCMGAFLRRFCSRTTANGIVGRGGMHVFSSQQVGHILERRAGQGGALLDIGAGDGGVTAKLAPLFSTVDVTETSLSMRYRLKKRGFTVVEKGRRGAYDVVACLNVLDRCDEPVSLLLEVKELLRPGTGLLLLAVVLPWCPFVEHGTRQRAPSQQLPMDGARCRDKPTFEKAVSVFLTSVAKPLGFEVLAWTRTPYLCEGSPSHDYYVLDDLLVVLKPDSS
mmetsp:Transcript_29004/g.56785  ORF Transcript_29004/g.56785 Transcript_29004/m.56785 type:complete len:284 (-) Transcript_29004:143-994(-)